MIRKWGYRPTPLHAPRVPFAKLAAHLLTTTVLPDVIDLSDHAPPVLDQGQTGSCVGMAHAGAIYTTLHAQGSPLPFVPSPLDIYQLARCIDRANNATPGQPLPPLQDEGTDPSLAQQAINQWGVRPIGKLAPFAYSDCWEDTVNTEPPLFNLEQDAETILVGQYAIIGPSYERVESVRRALANGVAVEVGSFVDTKYMLLGPHSAPYGRPDYSDKEGGGHDQYIIGAAKQPDGSFLFRVRNSWSESWGDRGSVWATEEFILQADDLNAISVKRTP